MKRFLKYFLTLIILIIVFIGMLIFSCSFPSSLIKENVASSSKTLNKEGNRKFCLIFSKFQIQEFDNYSDSLMINTAYSIDSKTPLYSAFTAKKDYIPNVTKKILEDKVGELNSSSKYDKHDEVAELEDTVNGIGEESFEYAKYWHGYLSILRPLLLIFDYQQIRILLIVVLSLLAIMVTTSIAEKKNKTIASLYLLSLFSIEYFYIGLSLINSIAFLIMMVSSLILVKRFEKIKDFGLFFFIIGICCGFFCLLDTPLITLCGPLILYFIFKNGDRKSDFKELLKFSLLWILGYVLIWGTKWILMDILYNRDLIKTAIGQVLYRSVGNNYSPLLAICINLIWMALPIMYLLMILLYIFIRYSKNINKDNLKNGKVFLLIGLMPIVWYCILSNHSVNHFFFTYRLLFITMFGIMLSLYYACDEPEE